MRNSYYLYDFEQIHELNETTTNLPRTRQNKDSAKSDEQLQFVSDTPYADYLSIILLFDNNKITSAEIQNEHKEIFKLAENIEKKKNIQPQKVIDQFWNFYIKYGKLDNFFSDSFSTNISKILF